MTDRDTSTYAEHPKVDWTSGHAAIVHDLRGLDWTVTRTTGHPVSYWAYIPGGQEGHGSYPPFTAPTMDEAIRRLVDW